MNPPTAATDLTGHTGFAAPAAPSLSLGVVGNCAFSALIDERGSTALTVAEVAARANMSPANLYRYYESKEALIEAVAAAVRIMGEQFVVGRHLGQGHQCLARSRKPPSLPNGDLSSSGASPYL